MNSLYFLWDYDFSEDKVRAILQGDNQTERLWLISRILSHAKYEDVWRYLKVSDIVASFPKLKLKPDTSKAWKHALNVWGYHV